MTDQSVEKMPNEQTIRQYLLNRMSEPEREAFEERYFDDYALFERVQSVEEVLFEDYARHQLAGKKPDWFSAFEAHYFATEERRERVESAKDLLTVSLEFVEQQVRQTSPTPARSVQQEKLPWWKSLSSLLRGQLYPALATAAAALFLVLGMLLLLQNLRLQNQLAQDQARRAELVRREQELAQQLAGQREDSQKLQTELAEVKKQLEQLNGKTPNPATDLIARLSFAPGSKGLGGNSGSKLTIPAGCSRVEIRITINTDEYKSFRAIIRPVAGGAAILNQPGLKAQGLSVVIALPADKLTGRNYALTLSGVRPAGEIDEIGRYEFQVERK